MVILLSLLLCLSNAMDVNLGRIKERYEVYKNDLLSHSDGGIFRLGEFNHYFSQYKNLKSINQELGGGFDDVMKNLTIDLFKESLEYDEKCDRVINLCEENYKNHILNLYRKNIKDDEVKCLKKYVFPVLKDLENLNLSRNLNDLILDNQITNIDKDSFSTLSKLEYLYLRSNLNDLILDNKISYIEQNAFQHLSKLQGLYLRGNLNIQYVMKDVQKPNPSCDVRY